MEIVIKNLCNGHELPIGHVNEQELIFEHVFKYLYFAFGEWHWDAHAYSRVNRHVWSDRVITVKSSIGRVAEIRFY